MKGSAGNVPASLPARNSESTGDTTIQSTQLRSHPEKGQVSTQGKFLTQQMRHTHLYTILERVVWYKMEPLLNLGNNGGI